MDSSQTASGAFSIRLLPPRAIEFDYYGSLQFSRVVVVSERGLDTIPGIEVFRPPVLVDGALVRGLRADTIAARELELFEWNIRLRTLTTRQLPELSHDSELALSGDGQWIGRIQFSDLADLGSFSVLETWDGRVLATGPYVKGPESDREWAFPISCDASEPFTMSFVWDVDQMRAAPPLIRHRLYVGGTAVVDTIPSGTEACDPKTFRSKAVANSDEGGAAPEAQLADPGMATEVASQNTDADSRPRGTVFLVFSALLVGAALMWAWMRSRLTGAIHSPVRGEDVETPLAEPLEVAQAHETHSVVGGTETSGVALEDKIRARPQAGPVGNSQFTPARVIGVLLVMLVLTFVFTQLNSPSPVGGILPESVPAVSDLPPVPECTVDANGSVTVAVAIRSADDGQNTIEIGSAIWRAARDCPSATRVILNTTVTGADKYGNPTTRQVEQQTFGQLDEVRRYRTARDYSLGPPDEHLAAMVATLIHIGCAYGTLSFGVCR